MGVRLTFMCSESMHNLRLWETLMVAIPLNAQP